MNKSLILYSIFIIIFCSCIQQTRGKFLDYTDNHLVCCNENQCQLTSEKDACNTIILHEIDKYFLVIAGPIAICCTLFIIITFISYPKIREQPGDIILGISVSDFVLSIHWTIMSAYSISHQQSPDNESNFCQGNALFSVAAGTLEFLYNMCFCIYLFITIRSSQQLRLKTIPKYIYHGICIIISLVVVIYFKVKDQLGLNLFGTCSIANYSDLGWQGIIILFVYLIISWGCVFFFKKYVPKDNEKISSKRKVFLQYYFYYVIASSIIFTVIAVCNLLASLNCGYILQPGLNVVLTIGNIAKVMTPITLSIIRYKDPILKNKIKSLLSKFGILKNFNKSPSQDSFTKQQQNSLDDNLVPKNHSTSQFEIQMPDKSQSPNVEIVENRATSNSFGNNWLDSLTSSLRIAQIYTLIAGIQLNHKQYSQKNQQKQIQSQENQMQQTNFTGKEFQEIDEIQITQDSLNDEKIEQITDKAVVQPLHSKLQIYAPKIFQQWREQDKIMIDLEKSLNLINNFPNIKKKFGEVNQGGKSGEFFYSSYDNRIIVKTMQQDELDAFLEKFDQFYEYYKTHKDSLIVKIYGIYTINRVNQCESNKLHAFIMRSVSSCDKSQILCTYDLKGSLFDREVLNKQKNANVSDISKLVLKDIDFQKLENKIKIEKTLARKCSKILEEDSNFLQGCGFIDYSLVVFKINWEEKIQELQDQFINFKQNLFSNELFMIQSNEVKNIFYQFSIIDYLQKWNYQKMLEKQTKKLININKRIDPSAQDPKFYGERFREKIAKGLFILKTEDKELISISLN